MKQPVIAGTCTTCHDTPNAGNHSFSVPQGIGTTAYPVQPALDITGLPVCTVQRIATGQTVQVTDIGRVMVPGKCSDIGKVQRSSEFRLLRNSGLSLGRTRIQKIFKVIA